LKIAKKAGTENERPWQNDKLKAMNLDMWQRYNDCILCEQKSIPNTQGVVIQHSTRNILIAFNKTL